MRAPKTRFVNGALLLAFWFGIWVPAVAAALVLPGEPEFALALRPAVEAYEDRTGRLDFDGVRRLAMDEPDVFHKVESHVRTDRHPHSAWWLRTAITNASDVTRHLVLVAGPPNLENVDFYLEQRDRIHHGRAGTLVPILEQDDLGRFPTLLLDMAPGESVRIWIKIKSQTPSRLYPILYTSHLFSMAGTITGGADGLLAGAAGALVWCMLIIGVMAGRPPFLWIAGITAAGLTREAAAREYLQQLLWPLDATWGYRLELTLDFAYLALCALFVRSASRRELVPVPGSGVYTGVTVALCAGLPLSMFFPAHGALLSLPATVGLFQALSGAFGACMVASAVLLVRRARTSPSPALARHAFPTAALLCTSALLIVADAMIRTTGPLLDTPLVPISFILSSGSPSLALLAMAATLTALALWAVRQLGPSQRFRMLALHRVSAPPDSPGTVSTPRVSPAGSQPPSPAPQSAPTPQRFPTPQPAPASPSTPAPPPAPAPSPAREALSASAATDAERQATILSYVGHDLRAPLAIISGYIRLLRQAAAPAQHAYLDIIERSISHQFGLIEEVLAYSKSELQPFAVRPEETRLPGLMEELAHFGIALCTEQRNTFEYLPAPTLPAAVWVDGKRLRQAVLNLLSNASKFTTEGIVRLDAQVHRRADRQADLHVSVFNDGPPIPARDQAGIFVAFKQLHRRESGTGLGLFIVERIVQSMGGTVQLDSSPESGNRFSLTIPVTLADPSVVPTRQIGRAPAQATATPQLEAPPLAVRLVLSRLARDGELSEIENWVVETRAVYPRYTGFYDEVVRCVETFDMECLQRLALQGTI